MSFTETLQSITGKLLADCTDQELYLALLELVRQKSADRVQPVTGRKLYYISAEFLIGKLLSNNLINLGLYDDVRSALQSAGKKLSDIEEETNGIYTYDREICKIDPDTLRKWNRALKEAGECKTYADHTTDH